ncbi:MAG: branched-chain amino acid ABC transporter permease [Promethearchaeota archaeon]
MTSRIKSKITALPSYLKSWIKTFRGGVTIICLIILFIIPIFLRNPYHLGIFITAMIFTIFAASWDFLAGFAGQVSFGQAIFLGVAGYFTAYFFRNLDTPWWLSVLIGSLASVGFGLLIGIPCLRLKGPYLALGTLTFSLIIFDLLMMGGLADILFGTEGISRVPPIFPITENYQAQVYIIVLIVTIISLELLILIGKSNLGTILKSIRDDSTSAEASGINITRYKIIAFMISSFFGGIAGGFFAIHLRAVNPAIFGSLYSFYAIIMASLGGLATISGSALGAFFFIFLGEALRPAGDYSVLIFSIVLILIVRFAEHGLLKPIIERLKDLWDLLLGR